MHDFPFEQCPAKTSLDKADGSVRLGRSTFDHWRIVNEVARALLLRLPESLYGLFPPNAPDPASKPAALRHRRDTGYMVDRLMRRNVVRTTDVDAAVPGTSDRRKLYKR